MNHPENARVFLKDIFIRGGGKPCLAMSVSLGKSVSPEGKKVKGFPSIQR